MKRLLVFEENADRYFGGAEMSMAEFIDVLQDDGIEVDVVCGKGDLYPGRVIKIGAPPPFKQPIAAIKWILQFHKIIKSSKPDAMLTHCVHCLGHLAFVSLLCTIPLKIYFKWIPANGNIPMYYKLLKYFPVDIASNSQVVQHFWQGQLNFTGPIFYDGVADVTVPRKQHSNRQHYGLHIGFVGRVSREKGVHLLLDLTFQIPDVTITIIGEQSEEFATEFGSLLQKTIELGTVKLLGFQKNPFAHLQGVDLVVCPSVVPDSAPRTAMEAMMHGIPVATSTQVGMNCEFGQKQAGLIFPPTVKGLSAMIESFASWSDCDRDLLLLEQKQVCMDRFSAKSTHKALMRFVTCSSPA